MSVETSQIHGGANGSYGTFVSPTGVSRTEVPTQDTRDGYEGMLPNYSPTNITTEPRKWDRMTTALPGSPMRESERVSRLPKRTPLPDLP